MLYLLLFIPNMPIGMLGIYCLLFVCFLFVSLFLCLQDFGNGYLGRGLA